MVQIHVSNEQVDLTAKYRNQTKKIYTHMTFRPINGHCQMQLEHNQIIGLMQKYPPIFFLFYVSSFY